MKSYYYSAISLPELSFDSPPEYDFATITDGLKNNLAPKDYEQLKVIRLFFDIENIRSLYKKEPLNPYGNLDKNELDDALVTGSGLPTYVYDFLEKYENIPDRLHHFSELFAAYFREEVANSHDFVHDFLGFERDLRLVLTAFRAKVVGRDITEELQYEDPDDPIVAQILAQKDSNTFEPPAGFEDLKTVFNENMESPLNMLKALSLYRFKKIDQLIGLDSFTMQRILGYYIQLILVESWFSLNKKKGLEIVKNILQGTL